MNLGILNELSSVNLSLHFIDGTEIIMHAILFSLAWLARRVADGEAEFIGGE